ncbi:MAG: Uma2 family endonuclease [Saprospiraceae bacterium]|nr:Uma2 family endonuclease [Saprospiraceae bacterium]
MKDIQEIQGDNKTDIVPNLTTVTEFELWLLKQSELADKRFEFVDGRIIEKEGMKQNDVIILKFLSRLFVKTPEYEAGDELFGEIDSYINDRRKRIPDIVYWTAEQIEAFGKGKKLATSFAIEILSPNDNFQDVAEKIQDYFEAGAKLVWYILPKQEQIYVYTAPTEVKILKGDDICSGEPVLSDFSFTVKKMFV